MASRNHAVRSGKHWSGLASRCCALVAVLACLFAVDALAQDEAAALQIKAAFVHKFAGYVQGAGTAFDQTGTTLVYGVAGSDQAFAFLFQLAAGQNDTMHPAEVHRVATSADLAGVHILFVGQDMGTGEANVLLGQAVAMSILTVTDSPAAQPPDSMIHFFVADDRVRFDIALAPAERAGLRLSSRLLQVAREVIGATTVPGD